MCCLRRLEGFGRVLQRDLREFMAARVVAFSVLLGRSQVSVCRDPVHFHGLSV